MDKTILYIKTGKNKRDRQNNKTDKKWKEKFFSKMGFSLPFVKKEELTIAITRYPLIPEELEVIQAEVEAEASELTDAFGGTLKKQLTKLLQKEENKVTNELLIWFSPILAETLNQYPSAYPQNFLDYIHGKLPFSDTIYIKDGMKEECFSFVERIYFNCNRMIIWVPEEDRLNEWDTIADSIYQNTGLLVKVVEELPEVFVLEKDKWRNTYQALFFDFSDSENTAYRKVPKNTIYIDLFPTKQKRRILTGKRSDITYLTYANFLDMNADYTV